MMNDELTELLRAAAAAAGFPAGDEGETVPVRLSQGGSTRHFFRLVHGDRSAVALITPGGGDELESYAAIGTFLRRSGIPVPALRHIDTRRGVIVMDDLGDLHLEDALGSATTEQARALYLKCLDILVRLQTVVTKAMERDGILADRIFSEDVLLGETAYFVDEFIGGYCPVPLPIGWEDDRRRLASILARQPLVFMHRDFQSRNVLISDGEPAVIDFQTAHRGPGCYDAASLLRDAYHPLERGVRLILLEELHGRLRDAEAAVERSFEAFFETMTVAGIQRNLQALAAFAKLGGRLGKREFLDSIPAGIALLAEGVEEAGRFAALRELVYRIREYCGKGRT
jgi:aminoglycoside/choline kinase family phosphotransferase